MIHNNIRNIGKRATKTAIEKDKIIKEFEKTINSLSLENDSCTPDFIIAEYLYECLLNFQITLCQRIYWYNSDGNNLNATISDAINRAKNDR